MSNKHFDPYSTWRKHVGKRNNIFRQSTRKSVSPSDTKISILPSWFTTFDPKEHNLSRRFVQIGYHLGYGKAESRKSN